MKRRAFTLVEIMIVVLIIGILMAIAVPNFLTARTRSQDQSCIANLRSIEGAKYQWAMVEKKADSDSPSLTDLVNAGDEGYLKSLPICPMGGTYSTGSLLVRPKCTVSSHVLP